MKFGFYVVWISQETVSFILLSQSLRFEEDGFEHILISIILMVYGVVVLISDNKLFSSGLEAMG